MNLNNLKIGSRLTLLIAVMAALLVGIGAFSLISLRQSSDAVQSVIQENLKATHELDDINLLMTRNRLIISNALLDPTPEKITKYSNEVEANIATITQLWQSFLSTPMPAEMVKSGQSYADARKAFVEKGLRPALAALRANDLKEARHLVLEQIDPLYNATSPHLDALITALRADGKQDANDALTRYQSTRALSLGIIAFGLLFAALFGLLLVRGITRPLARAVTVAESVAAGRFDDDTSSHAADETGQLLRAMGQMQTALKQAAIEAEVNQRLRTTLEGVAANVMIADVDLNVLFVNRAVLTMLSAAESDIRKDLPNFQTSKVLGSNIDIFHKNPAHQRAMLSKLRETYRAQINVGGRTFGLIATPIFAAAGERIGTAVEWQDRTAEIAARNTELALMTENTRIRNALDKCSTNVMIANADNEIISFVVRTGG